MPLEEKPKIRVLHIITRLIIGGAQQNTILSALGLKQTGDYDLTILSGPQTGPEGSLIKKASSACTLHILKELRRNINPFYDLIAFVKLIWFIQKGKFDIIHTHSSKAGILGRWAAKCAGTKIIVHTIHGWGHNTFQGPIKRSLYINLERLTLAITDKLIGVSKINIENGLACGIGKANDYELIRSGIDLKRFKNPKKTQAQICKQLTIDMPIPVIGTVTRLSAQKAPLDFIQSCAIISKNRPHVRFVIVGDGPLREKAEELVSQLGLKDRLIFTGLRSDVPELMSIFSVFALSSLWEGLPRVLPQAMALKLPIVATDIDGNSEAIINQQNGLLVPPGDYRTMADSIISLLDNPQKAKAMGEDGFSRIEEFSVEKMVNQIDSLYRELMSCGK